MQMRIQAGALALLAGTVWLLVAAGDAGAQPKQQPAPDPQRGAALAGRLCTTCHVIDSTATGPTRTDVPSFPAIANRAEATAIWIAGAIIIPHPAMPDVQLTMAEVRDVVAYIQSLKRN